MKRTHKEKITSVLALCAGAGLFIWFCIPLFWGVFHVGNGGGILFSLFLIAGGIWYVPLRSRMEQAKHAKLLRVLRRSCWGILAVCFAWAAFLTGCMLWPTPSPSGSGTVVILGCKVGSAALQARIDAAAEYLHSHPDAVAIASGGRATGNGYPKPRPSAAAWNSMAFLPAASIWKTRVPIQTKTLPIPAGSSRRRALTQPVSW